MKTKIDLICPRCNATLTADSDREFLFCQYCGYKILLNDENRFTYKHINEDIDVAELKKAETEQMIRLKELENESKKEEFKRKIIKKALKPWLIISIAAIVLGGIGYLAGSDDLGLLAGFGVVSLMWGGLFLLIEFF